MQLLHEVHRRLLLIINTRRKKLHLLMTESCSCKNILPQAALCEKALVSISHDRVCTRLQAFGATSHFHIHPVAISLPNKPSTTRWGEPKVSEPNKPRTINGVVQSVSLHVPYNALGQAYGLII